MLPRLSAPSLALSLLAGCYVGSADSGDTGDAPSTGAVSPTTGPTGGPEPGSSGAPDPGTGGYTTMAATGVATLDPPATGEPPDATTDAADMSSGPGPDDTGAPASTGPDEPPLDPGAMVCARWTADRADLSEGAWSGAVEGCVAGDVAAPGRANALRQINLYRWLAGMPPVAEDAGWSAKAQSCALMMHANGQLSHSPPANWACYAADGAEAAGKSNISTTPGVLGVDLYMVDPGNPTTIGHRRWILSNALGQVGLGSTANYSCLWVIGGQGVGSRPWTAWPPDGIVPYEAIHVPQIPWAHVDETGWTLQSDSVDVTKAQIAVTEGGVDRPMQVTALASGYGSTHAVSMIPQGWVTEPGKTYQVAVSGVPEPFTYAVQVVQCE